MRLYRVEALVAGNWLEWIVLATSKEAAIKATNVESRPGVRDHTVSAYEHVEAWILSEPRSIPAVSTEERKP